MPQIAKITGSQGSWEAKVRYRDGQVETLACVHKLYWKNGPDGPNDDPWTGMTSKYAKFIETIRSKGRVILTNDEYDPTKGRGEGCFKRTDYIAVYTIDDLVVNDEGMRFRFTGRYAL